MTRSLNISYLRGIPINVVVRINSKVAQMGGTMALIQSEMTSLDGKITYCTAENHKVRVPTPAQNLDPKYDVDWDRAMKAKGTKENGLWTPKKAKGKL